METQIATPFKTLCLTAKEVARLLGVSVRHVYKLHASGRLPRPVRLSRSARWRRAELEAWLAQGSPERSRWEKSQTTWRV
jgi:excisionase family DNA binding protein